MGIGGTAKKLQKVAEMGEELYKRINDLRAQVSEMRETVTATHDRVDRLENEVAEQRAILEALAESEGVNLDAVVAEAHIDEAERDAGGTGDTDTESHDVAGHEDGGDGGPDEDTRDAVESTTMAEDDAASRD